VICISRAVQKHVRRTLGVPDDRALLIPNGIPALREGVSRARARDRLQIPSDDFVVLFVGRLERQKAVHVLIEAFGRIAPHHPTARLEIVGSGSLRRALQTQACQTGFAERIHFRGAIDGPEDFFSAADVLTLPSLFEGLGLVLLEAFRAGLPSIASDLEGPQELLRHNVNGLLVRPGDAAALADALVALLLDPARRAALARNARESFTQQYSIEYCADQLARAYGDAVARSRSAAMVMAPV
jgi:glycosyltransferase involved in cell wall biosynthesis